MKSLNRSVVSLTACAAALWMSGTAEAHHSAGQFEPGVCTNLQGTVRTLEWVYPHTWLWIIVPANTGNAADDVWGFEFPSPTQTIHLDPRWSKDVVEKGDKVTVTFSPLKGGRHGGWMHSVTLADGRVLAGAPGHCDPSKNPPGTK
jgi:hypothetical protein